MTLNRLIGFNLVSDGIQSDILPNKKKQNITVTLNYVNKFKWTDKAIYPNLLKPEVLDVDVDEKSEKFDTHTHMHRLKILIVALKSSSFSGLWSLFKAKISFKELSLKFLIWYDMMMTCIIRNRSVLKYHFQFKHPILLFKLYFLFMSLN